LNEANYGTGTAAAKLTATVKSAAAVGTVSAGYSSVRVADDESDSAVANNVDSTSGGTNPAVGTNGRINFSLKDGNNVAMPSSTIVTATATGGCLVATSNTTSALISASATTASAASQFYVARATANAPASCSVAISVNGVAFVTKTLVLQGKVTKLEVIGGQAGISNAYASSSISSTDAFAYNAYDAAGNIVYSITPTFVNTPSAAFTAATNAVAAARTVGYGLGNLTCTGLAKGSGSFLMQYVNNVGETISSPSYTANCFGTAYTYTAAFDKSSYVPGDIATLTITAKDSKGNPANDYVYLGGTAAAGTGTTNPPSIAGSNMTAVTAPTSTDMFSGGVKKYKFIVGSTEGSYQMVVDLPKFNDSTIPQAAVVVPYTIKASSASVSNAEVLAAIVKLIASINKQIAALQKALTKKK